MANLKAQELDTTLLNADRQALAEALDAEKASRELGEKLRAEALEKVDGAIELVKSVIYEAEKGSKGA